MNQIPGASFFTSKWELAKKAEQFDFIPRTFVMPEQYDDFTRYLGISGRAHVIVMILSTMTQHGKISDYPTRKVQTPCGLEVQKETFS